MTKEKQWNTTDEQSVRADASALSGQNHLDIRMMLRNVRDCQMRTLTLCARAERYREMATQATGRTDALRVSGTSGRSKVETYVLELWETHNQLQAEITRLMEQSREAERLIKLLPDKRYRAILELRYLCGMTWEQIADKLHFTLRWAHQLHSAAIDALMEAANRQQKIPE